MDSGSVHQGEGCLNTLPANKLRVLFVDDEPPIRDVMKIELPRMGHEATICEDGAAAIAAVDKHFFDVAIVDLRMPGLSGWDVIDHLKKVSPETEVIISTGHGSMDEAIQALRRGAYDFLPKPCKLFEIANVLKRVGEKVALSRKTVALERRLESVEGDSSLVGETPVDAAGQTAHRQDRSDRFHRADPGRDRDRQRARGPADP